MQQKYRIKMTYDQKPLHRVCLIALGSFPGDANPFLIVLQELQKGNLMRSEEWVTIVTIHRFGFLDWRILEKAYAAKYSVKEIRGY